MDSNRSKPHKIHPFRLKLNPILFYMFSVLVLVLAIAFSFTKSNYFRIQYLKSTLSSESTIFQKLFRVFYPTVKRKETLTQMSDQISMSSICVLWMAPFLSGGGYSSEAWSYILSLNQELKNPRFRLAIEQHGDLESFEFWEGLPQYVRDLAYKLYQTECRVNETVVVCHSEPGAWYPPLFDTVSCPPTDYSGFVSVIGRTMFETDRLSPVHVERCNRMDFVWVPTDFHVSTFIESGVDPSKVVKVIQPIDVEFFNPPKYEPFDLVSVGELVVGTETPDSNMRKEFVFLSIFKWEYRKGWDVLLKAYLKEFSKSDGVGLYLLTNPYHSDSDFGNKILEFVEDSKLEKPAHGWAPVYVIDTHIAQVDFPRVYKAANAFVLPSRGEGWGRPMVEAMSMGLPVIATNWSGPTEYMTDENSYPLPLDRMSEVTEGPFKGHLWAEPSVDELRILMRRVMSDIEEAKGRGKRAREDMIRRFSPEIVAGIVAEQIQNILTTRQ